MHVPLLLLLITYQADSATQPPRGTTGAPAAPRCASRAHAPLARLRAYMTNLTSQYDPLNAYIVPSLDEHQSESPGERDRRLWYASGWDGPGWAVILAMTGAALWTDAAAVPLARSRLSCEWSVFAADGPNATSLIEWLQINIDGARRVGADNRLIPHSTWKEWAEEMSVHHMMLVPTPELLDQVWESDGRPPPPKAQVFTQNPEFAGKSWQTKVAELRSELRAVGADAMVVTALDEIAWLLNIRGKDTLYSPIVKCYLLVTQRDLHLYIPPGKLSIEASRNLNTDRCFNTNCTKVHVYNEIWGYLRSKTQPWEYILLPAPSSFYPGVSEAIYSSVPETKRMHKTSPIIYMKAVKNAKEIEGMRKAHIRDSATFCQILSFLEKEMKKGEVWDEIKVIKLIDSTRAGQALNQGSSFQTIVAFGPNGAIPHYIADNRTTRVITKNSTLVIDSGGQYDDGTTDLTRTLHFGKPTAEHKKSYTLVLMACIELARMEFPASLRISDVDIIPRSVLWQSHKNYLHSTGHGVGSFLHVHEDPINVLYHHRQKLNFKPGQFFSNEPGIYEEGSFGVRLENILEVIKAPAKAYPDQNGPYLAFRDITLVPYESKLIEYNMLTLYQRRWLNEYNSRIREVIGAELKQQIQMDTYWWMMNKTFHIPEDDIFRRHSASAFPLIVPKSLIGIFVLVTNLSVQILM